MEKIATQALLYDFYGVLLTDHQRKIYEDVVFEDMSLTETAEGAGISRQGVHDVVKRCTKTMEEYEAKLGLIAQHRSIARKSDEIAGIAAALALALADGSSDSVTAQDAQNDRNVAELARIEKLAREIAEEA